ncbi:MAG: hypothetical protein QNI99_00795 [Woeseiaceae bacterium]|nr:hypothetical protein [Woeseiaceae bacterium]
MAWIRYLLYFLGITLLTGLLTWLEVTYPGSLRLHVFVDAGDTLGTSEFSPVELMQSWILIVCGLLIGWVAYHYAWQRPIAFPFGGLALMFLIRENDYFLDRYVFDNLWPVLVAIAGALVIAYTYRQRKRLRISLARIWPSAGLTLFFAGAVILFGFVSFIGHEPLWQSILGDDYRRVAKLAVEEFTELIGYFLWLVGAIEYVYQTREISMRDPQPAAVRRRQTKLGRRG